MPISSLEGDLILKNELVGGDADVPQVGVIPAFPLFRSLFSAAVVGEDLETRRPLLELHLPIEHNTGRDDNEMGAPYALLTRQVCD